MATCIKNCTVENRTILFNFPLKNPEMMALWINNLGLEADFKPKSTDRVCNRHFTADCIGIRKLLKGNVPTLFGAARQNIILPVTSVKKACSVKDCVSASTVRTFPFPKTPDMRRYWKIRCGLENVEEPKHLYACENHFRGNYMGIRKLKKGVFPTKNLPVAEMDEDMEPFHKEPAQRVYSSQRMVEGDISLQQFEKLSRQEDIRKVCASPESENLIHISGQCYCGWEERYSKQQKVYQQKLQMMNRKMSKLTAEISQLKAKHIIPNSKASKESISFAKLIVSGKNVYNEDDKHVAQNIEYISSKVYTFMRDTLGFKLPSKSSLRNWRPIKCMRSGRDTAVMENLKLMVDKMNNEQKECVLLLDEVTISKGMVYNKSNDRIDGLIDFSMGHRAKEVATKALVFMLKGILSSWKYVLSYYATSDGLKHSALKDLILENVNVAQNIGLTVANIVMDQGTANLGAAKDLGVTEDDPYYISSNGDKIFLMYDYCHLQKSIRNTLLAHDIHTSHGTASIRVLRAMYEADCESLNIRMAHKLKYAHVYPTKTERMKVSTAAQLLSHTSAATIKTLDSMNYFSDNLKQYINGTVYFVEMFNKMFDLLNSKLVHDKNPEKRPIYRGNIDRIEFIMSFIEYLESFEFENQSINKCVRGYILTLKCFLQMRQHIFVKYPRINFILFGKCNQDALENLFFKNNLNISIDLSEADDDNGFDVDGPPITTVEAQVLPYYTGYTIFAKFAKKIKCEKCVEMATGPSTSASTFMQHKAFNVESIVVPSGILNYISNHFFRIYKQIFTDHYHIIDLRRTIITEIQKTLSTSKFCEWFDNTDPCFEHREALLDFYITVLLYKNCKNINDKYEAERAIKSKAKASEKAHNLKLAQKYKRMNL